MFWKSQSQSVYGAGAPPIPRSSSDEPRAAFASRFTYEVGCCIIVSPCTHDIAGTLEMPPMSQLHELPIMPRHELHCPTRIETCSGDWFCAGPGGKSAVVM